jgi:voltage-gated potassium channel Kch
MPKKQSKLPLKIRLHYAFDNVMSGGVVAVIGWLALISIAFIVVAASIISFTGVTQDEGRRYGFFEAAWLSLLRTLDAGTMGADTGWEFRIIMLLVTLGGIFIVSTLIGILSSGIERKIEELRKGRSFVVERKHTIILGWSTKIYSIISELIIANQNKRKFRIVILGTMDKLEMEDEIKSRIQIPKNTKIICRSGNPMDTNNLQMVNINKAKSIIILDDEKDNMFAIKTLLALVNNPQRKPEPYNVVAEIGDKKNLLTAKMVGGKEAKFILSDELISRIVVQTCRHEGLSNVYVDLLNFSDDEIYFKEEPLLIGKTFAESVSSFDTSSVIGIRYKNGEIKLNPPMETKLSEGDKLIVVAEDDDTTSVSFHEHQVQESDIKTANPEPSNPKKILILGWNHRGSLIVKDLDNYMIKGSEVMIVAKTKTIEETISSLQPELKNITIKFHHGDINDRNLLEHLNIYTFNNLILLCYSDDESAREADAKNLISLLHVRDILNREQKTLNIVTEMADIQDVELAKITKEDDFVVSDILVSLMIAQLAENSELKSVFESLFNPDGSELYVKNAKDFVVTGKPMNFYTVVESAKRQQQVVIGYRIQNEIAQHNKNYGIVLNPKKSNEITFSDDDKIIVIAEGK